MIEMKDGVLRFKANRIVQDVYDHHRDLNEITMMYQQGKYTSEELYQFLALLGYSFDGLWEKILQDRKLFPDKEDE